MFSRLIDTRLLIVLIVALIATLAVACGGGGEEEVAAVAPTMAPAVAPTTAPAVAPTTAPAAAATAAPVPAPTVAPKAAPAAAKVLRGGHLRKSASNTLRVWDITQDGRFIAVQNLGRHYSGLLRISPRDGTTFLPDLAKSWEFSKDFSSVTLELDDGLKFHDGTPVTMEDVLYTFDRVLNPPKGISFPRLTGFKNISDLEVADDRTIRISQKQPTVDFLEELANPYSGILPKHIADQEGGINSFDRVIGAGPFQIVNGERDSFVESERYADYHLTAPDGKPYPYLDGVTTVIIPDADAEAAAFRTGRLDLVGPFGPGLDLAKAVGLQQSVGDQAILEFSLAPGLQYVALNGEKPPFDDIRARRALLLAIDKKALADFLQVPDVPTMFLVISYFGTTDPFMDEVMQYPGFNPQTREEDLAEAKRLFQEVGLKEVNFHSLSIKLFTELAQLIAQQLEDLGIKVNITTSDVPSTIRLGNEGDFQMIMHGATVPFWNPLLVSDMLYMPGGGWWFHNTPPPDEFVSLLDKSRITPPGAERNQLFKEMDRVMREEWIPDIPVVRHAGDPIIRYKYVHNYEAIPAARFLQTRYVDTWMDESRPGG